MSKRDDDEAGLRDSGATPYIYSDYLDAVNIPNERAAYRTVPEIESQFKKPYLIGDHVPSEWQLSGPEYPGLFPPQPWIGPSGGDCEIQGDALGGGYSECSPKDNCGVWVFSCCHKIISFGAINGYIKSVVREANDICRVVFCSNNDKGSVTANPIGAAPPYLVPIERSCVGPGHSTTCYNCDQCKKIGGAPTVTVTSYQMTCSGTQLLRATGGGGGPYKWTTTSGSFSMCTTWPDQGTIFTAPATNANCANNSTITVKDFCGLSTSFKIAVNCYGGADTAYQIVDCKYERLFSCTIDGSNRPVCSCASMLEQQSYKCDGTYKSVADCSGASKDYTGPPGMSCLTACPEVAFCASVSTCASLAKGACCGTLGVTCDSRSSDMKTQGCCPLALA